MYNSLFLPHTKYGALARGHQADRSFKLLNCHTIHCKHMHFSATCRTLNWSLYTARVNVPFVEWNVFILWYFAICFVTIVFLWMSCRVFWNDIQSFVHWSCYFRDSDSVALYPIKNISRGLWKCVEAIWSVMMYFFITIKPCNPIQEIS